jgi:signal transduction histidine kinase
MEEQFGKETLVKEMPKLTPEGEAWFSPTGPVETAEQLSAGLLHLINNKMVTVQGYLEFGMIELPENQVKKDFRLSLESAKDITRIMKKLKELNDACQIDNYSFSRGKTDELIKAAGKFMPEGEDSLKIEFSGEKRLLADKRKFSYALACLFTNSLEAGASQVEVGVREEEGKTVVEITDNGEGVKLPKEDMFGLKFSTKTVNGGLQVLSTGLFVAKTVVLAHGGSIEIGNRKDLGEEASGTRVTIKLPSVDGF